MRRRAPVVAAAAGVVALVALVAGARGLSRARTFQLGGALVARGPVTSPPRVALTFDDGPTPYADTLLAELARRGVRATFFVNGAELARHPAAGRALVAAGHALGNHGDTHRRLVLVSGATIRREVERTDSAVRRAGYAGPIDFRPPYGHKLVGLPRYLARTGRTTVMWSVEPESYPDVAATPEGIVRHVLDRVRPGDVILLHPWYPSRATTRAAVGPLVDSLLARGYRVGTVRELLGAVAAAR